MVRRALFLCIAAVFLFAACGESSSNTVDTGEVQDNAAATDQTIPEDTDVQIGSDTSADTEDSLIPDVDDVPVVSSTVVLETTAGNITLGLYGKELPVTSANFETYVKEQFFDGLTFHRVVKGFVIQGGGYDVDFNERATHDPISFESHPKVRHVKYALSMARSDNIDSATSQFFITLKATPHLDYNSEDDLTNPQKFPCAVFGIVTEGFDVVDAIGAVETKTEGMFEDTPATPILIQKAYIKE